MKRPSLKVVLFSFAVIAGIVGGTTLSYYMRRAESNYFAKQRERNDKSHETRNTAALAAASDPPPIDQITPVRNTRPGGKVMFEAGLWVERLDENGFRFDHIVPKETVFRFSVDVWVSDDPLNSEFDYYVGTWGSPEQDAAASLARLIKFIGNAYGQGFRKKSKVYVYVRDIMNHTWCKPSGTPVDRKNAYAVELDVRSGDIRD